jgi:uncharacterized protein
MKLRITAGSTSFDVVLDDTPTARALLCAVPFTSRAQTWGEEVYFNTPVSARLEPGAKQVVEPGTVCFWTEGDAMALPFGRTPMSTDERPRLASPCNVVGRLEGDPRRLAAIRPGAEISVQSA